MRRLVVCCSYIVIDSILLYGSLPLVNLHMVFKERSVSHRIATQ